MSGRKNQVPIGLGDDLREYLEKSAKEHGHSLAEEVRRRCWASLAAKVSTKASSTADRMKLKYISAWESQ